MPAPLCAKCESRIVVPFTCNVFTADGKEQLLRDEIPKDVIDGQGSVLVFLHKKCRTPGKILGKNKGSNGKMTYGRQRYKCAAGPDIKLSAADELREAGFAVASKGHRFLMVFPKLMSEEVKRL